MKLRSWAGSCGACLPGKVAWGLLQAGLEAEPLYLLGETFCYFTAWLTSFLLRLVPLKIMVSQKAKNKIELQGHLGL